MANDRERGADPALVLDADRTAIDALVGGDPTHWQALAEHLVVHQRAIASPAVVTRLLEREPDVSHLLAIAKAALRETNSDVYTTTITAMRAVRAWLGEGIAAAFAPTHPAALEMRYARELGAADGVEVARALVADVRCIAPPRPRLTDTLLLLARRAHEESSFEEGLAAATEAETLYLAAADTSGLDASRRLRGASLLSLERFEEAFAILDAAMIGRGASLVGASRSGGIADQRAYAIHEAATVAAWADGITPEWVRALGGIAERTSRPDLWKRFEAHLVRMVDGSRNPASDLEVVIRQAGQRDLGRTVRAARDLAATRGLDPDSVRNPYFG